MVATSLGLVFILGAVGLSVDIGRMYIAKSESQAYVDAAALSAARHLDGSSGGITKAKNAATAAGGKWRFNTSSFTDVTTTFSTASTGPWIASPPSPPTDYYYVRVFTRVNLPMYLIRVLAGDSATISSSAVAGRTQLSTIRWGVFPFSPYIRKGTYTDSEGNTYETQPDPGGESDPFGFVVGNEYTLRWGSPGDRTNCGTDDDKTGGKPNQPLAKNGSIRGYCCVTNSASDLRESIVGGRTDSLTIGQNVDMHTGAKNTEMSAIGWRTDQDNDTTSTTYSQYVTTRNGNNARVVVVPVNSGPPTNYRLEGFAAFFLKQSSYYDGLNGNDSACAIYIGAWTTGTAPPPSGSGSPGTGAYVLRLFE